MKLKLYTDGWSRWNPWYAWIWVYITDENWNEVEKRYKYLWMKTNNEAEYTWALLWIKRCIELWWNEIELYADSDLVVKQLSWIRKIKKDELKIINTEILDLIKVNNIKISFNWIPRELNKEADRLSNVAMDKKC
jgi:ribonuclease HI